MDRHYIGTTPRMNKLTTALCASALFFFCTAQKCDKSASGSMDPMATLAGSQWNLISLAGQAIQLPEGVKNPFLRLGQDGALSGFGGCNNLMGSMKLDGSSISFPGLGSTKMFCKEAQPTESAFMTALRATNTYRLDGDKLVLLDKDKELAQLAKQ